MTKSNQNIHVLADETLGGIKREYVEVDRKAEVGEKVIITERVNFYMDDMTVGKVYEVIDISGEDVEITDDTEEKASVSKDGYRTLVPLNKENKHQKSVTKTRGYKEVKNLIHNELGITRQDIQEMISTAVSNEVKKMSETGDFYRIASTKIDSIIEEGIGDGGRLLYGFKERVSETVSNEVGKRIANVLNINVELKGERN